MRTIYLLLLLPFFFACTGPRLLVSDVAKPAALPPGSPRYSDVCFSSRWERPRNEDDTLETFAAARSFHASYINWVYTTDAAFMKKADSLGYRLQVALTPTLPDLPFGSGEHLTGRMRSNDGAFVTAPWMAGMDNWWGCVNHPAFREIYLAHIKPALQAGAYGFQVDDPAMNYLLLRNKWEDVCYCQYCLKKARDAGKTPNEIQQSSVLEFHQYMKQKAGEIAGRPVPFSCNNFRGDWDLFPFDFFDFGVAEIPKRKANPEYVYAAIREARRRGKAQVFSFADDRDFLVQKLIATTYACGGNPLVPWDVWQGGGKERYFGEAGKYAPLYGFARANARWLDGYEDAFYGTTQDDLRYAGAGKLPVSFEEYRKQIHAFVRAKPGDHSAPVVIHLVDWEVLTEHFSLRLNEKRFFKKGIKSVTLLHPVAYDATLHREAEASGDFSKLTASQSLPFKRAGNLLTLAIPQIERHWVILVLEGK
jgi:hypothetical protein